MPMPKLLITTLAVAICSPPAVAPATASPALSALSPASTSAVVDAVLREISAHYVIPGRREAIVAAVRAAQRQGRYDVSNPTELAARLGEDLATAGRDKHLWLRWSPEEYRIAQAPPDSGEAQAFFSALGRRRNQGVEALQILEGNVRYLRYTEFIWEVDVTGPAIDDAIRFLKGGDAMIVDLRGNAGGSTGAVQYLISHFMAEPGGLLVTFHDELQKTTRESRVLEHLPAGRVAGKPLYVLIDGATGSAAEEFATHVKAFKLGTLVGRTTAGAAHNNAVLPIAPGFLFSISTGRPVHAVTGGDWEGRGVAPDTAVTSATALAVAHLQAVDALAAKASDPAAKAAYAWARTALEARRAPPKVSEAELKGYVGRYGDRTIRLEQGALMYARPGRDEVSLAPLGGALFGFTSSADRRVRFVRTGGQISAMEIVFEDGQSQSFARATAK